MARSLLGRCGWMGLALLPWCVGCSSPPLLEVVLSTDIGVETDDQWALAHLALLAEAKRLRLVGVVTTHAPTLAAPAAESSARVAREVLAVLGLSTRPPVVAGSSWPLSSSGVARPGPGGRFILEASRGCSAEHRLRVLVIGAATDVAEALLEDPTVADRIEIVAMGFLSAKGEDPFNVKNDPGAYETILRARVPVVIGPADVCLESLTLDRASARQVTESAGRAGDYLQQQFDAWLEREPELCKQYTGREAWPIWDMVTVAYLLGLTQTTVQTRPTLQADLKLDYTGGTGELRWISGLDAGRLWKDLRSLLLAGVRR